MFSKRARYALHGVGFLAYYHGAAPLPFTEILRYLEDYSNELSLSPGYISKIFQDLSRAQIVRSALGRKGGYTLATDPEEVRVVDIVTAVDGNPVGQCCLLSIGGCSNQADCGVNQLIQKAEASFYDYLASETAGSLARKMFGDRGPAGFPKPPGQGEPAPPQEGSGETPPAAD